MDAIVTEAGIRSGCCEETLSRAVAGTGEWSCDNCHRDVAIREEVR